VVVSRQRSIVVVVVVAVALVLVALGRWEGSRNARHLNSEMRAVLTKVGPLYKTLPTGYRMGPPDCLAYPIPQNALGLEICFDSTGRVVETADRSGSQPKYASLVYDPSLATIRVPRLLVDRLLRVAKSHGN
jgi:hypothetical protein